MYLKEIGCEDGDWIELTQTRWTWQQVPEKQGIWDNDLWSLQGGTCTMKVSSLVGFNFSFCPHIPVVN
jgi:hypothetical protein